MSVYYEIHVLLVLPLQRKMHHLLLSAFFTLDTERKCSYTRGAQAAAVFGFRTHTQFGIGADVNVGRLSDVTVPSGSHVGAAQLSVGSNG